MWKPIDTRLVAADNGGGVVNKSGPFTAQLAADASSPDLVRIGSSDSSLSFALEGEVQSSSQLVPPSAAVGKVGGAASDTITYALALSSVDLRYQVLGEGVKEAIVLNQPLGPDALPSFRFSVVMTGLTAHTRDDGSIEFLDAQTGDVAYAIPAGLAMDADGSTAPVSVNLVPSADASIAELVVSIDNAWLSDPTRAFPVTIDPTVTLPIAYIGDEYIANGVADKDTSFWNIYSYDSTIGDFVDNAGVNAGELYRSLQTLDLSGLSGTDIVSAKWYGFADAVAGANVTLTLHPITAAWTPGVATWNNQPSEDTSTWGTATTSAYTSFGGWKSADITTWVQNWASGTPNYGIAIRGPATGTHRVQLAASDSGYNTSYLDVTYDAYPTTSDYSAGGQYQVGAVNTTTPVLSATITDSDSATGLTGTFKFWNNATCSGIASQSGSAAASVDSGEQIAWQLPSSASVGSDSWEIQGSDGTTTSDWSACQAVTIDQTAPTTPSVSIGSMTIGTWNTSGGAASASFSATDSGGTGVYGFEWGIDVAGNPTTMAVASSGAGSASFTPTWGWHDLAVRAVDNAGNVSGVFDFTFGWGIGGFMTPQNNAVTQQRVTIQTGSTATYSGIKLQWRRADNAGWTDVTVSPTISYLSVSGGGAVTTWPVSSTSDGTTSTSPVLIWDAASELGDVDGPVQLRAGFWNGSTYTYITDTPSIPHLMLNEAEFGGRFASTATGPGQVNLLTGNLALSATDVSMPAGSVTRAFQSRNPSVTGIFGPGWTSNIAAVTYAQLQDNGDTVLITENDGTELGFSLLTSSSYPYTYQSPAGMADLTLTKDSATQFTLTDLTPTTYLFTTPSGSGSLYLLSSTTNATGQTTSTTRDTAGRATYAYAPTPDGLFTTHTPPYSCASPPSGVSPLTTEGCQTLSFDYATTTQTTSLCGSPLGDYAGQLRSVSYTAWDPDKTPAAGMRTVVVADYCYDSNGFLRTEWDPRVSPALKVQYTYNSNGQVATLTPPGVNAWHFTYAAIGSEPASTGRVATVYQAAISPLGNATITFAYRIPLTSGASGSDCDMTPASGNGPCNMQASDVAAWGQQDDPTDATAVFPPSQTPSGTPPTDYHAATVYYLNANAQAVNVEAPGGYISTAEHDGTGNVIRTLTAANQQEALATGSTATQHAVESRLLDTENTYDPAHHDRLTQALGSAHLVSLPDRTRRLARQLSTYGYDAGSTTGEHDFLTSHIESAQPVDGTSAQDAHETDYAYTVGADTSGWALGLPLQTIVDPGTGTHLHLTTTTIYDGATGQLAARTLPGNPNGGDAHETDFVYYTVGTNTPSSCGSRPEWAGLLCYTTPYAQPGTVGLPNIATSQVTAYNMYGQSETNVDTTLRTGGSDTRTTSITYDAAGRVTSQHVTSTIGTALPMTTTTYDTATGQPYQTSNGTATITRTYDALGRGHTYTDGAGTQSTYYYDDLSGRLTKLDIGQGTANYSYGDSGSEARGLPTGITYKNAAGTSIATFAASYDADGRLLTQNYPGAGGLSLTYGYDEIGETVSMHYAGSNNPWPTSTAGYNIHGERTYMVVPQAYSYAYDTAGRLTQAVTGIPFGCPDEHDAQFDADTNRTQFQDIAGCAGFTTTTTRNSTYDDADRITATNGSSYSYDAFGRTSTVPTSDSGTGHNDTLTYYVNDLTEKITSNGTTVTHSLDPNQRLMTFVNSADSKVHTSHYANDGSSPTWTDEWTGGTTTWNRYLSGFNGMAAVVNQAGTVTLQLTNIHGDVFNTIAATATSYTGYVNTWTDEYGLAQGTAVRYDYLGAHQIKRDANSGLQLMGVRVYNPAAGRFLQPDPIFGGSANNYDYANGDPVNGTDLTGQSACHSCDVWIWMAAVYRDNLKTLAAAVHRADVARWNAALKPLAAAIPAAASWAAVGSRRSEPDRPGFTGWDALHTAAEKAAEIQTNRIRDEASHFDQGGGVYREYEGMEGFGTGEWAFEPPVFGGVSFRKR